MICPLLSIIFFQYQKFSGKHKGSFTKPFVSVQWDKRQKISTKPWCPPPPPSLLCMKIFGKRIFLKHHSVLQWNISVQWDKNFSTENRDTPPPPLLSIKNFSPTRTFLKHRMVPWRSFFGPEIFLRILSALWDKDFSKEFSDIPFLCMKFCDTPNFLKHRSVPQRNFPVQWDKKFWTKSRDTPYFA